MAALIVLGVAPVCLNTCSKKSTTPTSPKFSILFSDYGVSRGLYIADPESYQITDSIVNVGNVLDLQTSPDRESLYLLVAADPTHERGIYRYQFSSHEQTGYLAIGGGLAVVDKGRNIIVGDLDKLYVVDPVAFQISDTREIVVCGARGIAASKLVVGSAAATSPCPGSLSNLLAKYDYWTEDYDTALVDAESCLADAFLHPDERRAFVVACKKNLCRLFVIDFQTKKSVALATLNSAIARVVFSLSGDTAFVSNPQNPDDPDIPGCPRGEVLVFDLSRDDYPLLARVPTEAPVMALVLSPDGTRLYCTEAWTLCEGNSWGRDIVILDSHTLSFLPDKIELARPGQPREIAIGP